jgi:hypothetical protein
MEPALFNTQILERRSKPRIDCSYPAIVQGRDADGRKFRTSAVLTSLSANGLCLVLKSDIQPARDMFVLFRCSPTGPLGKDRAPVIAVDGAIVRFESPMSPMSEKYTVALKILRNRFL